MIRDWLRAGMLALALTGVAGVAGCGGARGAQDGAAPRAALLGPTDVAKVARLDVTLGVPVSGTLAPSVDVHITSPMPELLEAVLVKEGQRVAAGQVLARFRTEAVAPAAASAEAERAVAASDLERMRNLLAEGAVSKRDVERAEAALKSAESMAAAAAKRYDEAIVKAPVAGVIATRSVQSGDRVGDGDPLFRLVNTTDLEFEATVPSEYAGRVKPGAPVALTVAGAGGAQVEGEVARVNATADPATRQVKVYVVVHNRGGTLVGDLFASGRIVLDRAAGALAVPSAAVRGEGAERYVWVVTDGRLERRAVTPGLRDEQQDLVQVENGLTAGETVVIGPIEGLEEGQPVEITGTQG